MLLKKILPHQDKTKMRRFLPDYSCALFVTCIYILRDLLQSGKPDLQAVLPTPLLEERANSWATLENGAHLPGLIFSHSIMYKPNADSMMGLI